MATRKKKAKKSPAKRSGAVARAQSVIARVEAQLPSNVRKVVRRGEKAGAEAEKRIERLIRDLRKQLNNAAVAARKEAVSLLDRLEAAIAPAPAPKKRAPRRRMKKKA